MQKTQILVIGIERTQHHQNKPFPTPA